MIRCGTQPGYRLHQREQTMPCQACKTAHASFVRDIRANTAPKPRPEVHGTARALLRHRDHGTPVCDMCLYLACSLEKDRAAAFVTSYRRQTALLAIQWGEVA